jgi:hypothetical protein
VFYEVTDTYSHVLRRVLMYGKTGGEGPDIPDGWIWSLVRDPQNDLDCWHSPSWGANSGSECSGGLYKMNKYGILILALGVISMSYCLHAHTPADTNRVVSDMLDSRMIRSNMEGGRFVTHPNVVRQQSFFFQAGNGWTEEEKRGAFDWYLARPEEANQLNAYRLGEGVTSAAVRRCLDMNYTNAIPLIAAIVSGTNTSYRGVAIRTLVSWVGPSAEMTDMVCGIMTNVDYTADERRFACDEYAKKIKNLSADDPPSASIRNAAIARLYAIRHDWRNGPRLDWLFSECVSGYSSSSNRLSYVTEILDGLPQDDTAWSIARSRLQSITNQLMNAAQPLPEVEALRRL